MIDNNALGDRLKDFKNKQNSSNSIPPEIQERTKLIEGIFTLFAGVISVAKVFVFGYATKLIFNTDWNILGIACIGLSINFLLVYIHDLIYNDNKIIKL
jgi:hypothetical protein